MIRTLLPTDTISVCSNEDQHGYAHVAYSCAYLLECTYYKIQ